MEFENKFFENEKFFRGMSLFKFIFKYCFCIDVDIFFYWCVCLGWNVVFVIDFIIKKVVVFIVDFMNSLIEKFRFKCYFFFLKLIKSVMVMQLNLYIVCFFGSVDVDGWVFKEFKGVVDKSVLY